MSSILEPITVPGQYFGMIKISLIKYWGEKYYGQNLLSPESFKEYAEIRRWLKETNTSHKFEWINTGLYLPDYLWIDNSDSATLFKLKYGV